MYFKHSCQLYGLNPSYDLNWFISNLQAVSYTSDSGSLYVYWENYTDSETGIQSYQVSLLVNSSCGPDSTQDQVVDWITLGPNYTDYTFVDLDLQVQSTLCL